MYISLSKPILSIEEIYNSLKIENLDLFSQEINKFSDKEVVSTLVIDGIISNFFYKYLEDLFLNHKIRIIMFTHEINFEYNYLLMEIK